jgi:hypothetical protein
MTSLLHDHGVVICGSTPRTDGGWLPSAHGVCACRWWPVARSSGRVSPSEVRTRWSVHAMNNPSAAPTSAPKAAMIAAMH